VSIMCYRPSPLTNFPSLSLDFGGRSYKAQKWSYVRASHRMSCGLRRRWRIARGGRSKGYKKSSGKTPARTIQRRYGPSKETETHDLISTIERYLLQDSDQKAPAALLIASTTFSA
jgi:hypothetical protein